MSLLSMIADGKVTDFGELTKPEKVYAKRFLFRGMVKKDDYNLEITPLGIEAIENAQKAGHRMGELLPAEREAQEREMAERTKREKAEKARLTARSIERLQKGEYSEQRESYEGEIKVGPDGIIYERSSPGEAWKDSRAGAQLVSEALIQCVFDKVPEIVLDDAIAYTKRYGDVSRDDAKAVVKYLAERHQDHQPEKGLEEIRADLSRGMRGGETPETVYTDLGN